VSADIAEKIGTYRRLAGLTHLELARGCGVGLSAVTAWAGGAKRPSIENLVKLATLFELSGQERIAFYESAAR